MTNEDAVAGLWHSVLTRMGNDPQVTKQWVGFLSLVEPVAVLGETLYLDVPNELTKGMIEQRMTGLLNQVMASNADFGGPTQFVIAVNPALEGTPGFPEAIPEQIPVVTQQAASVPSYLAGTVAPATTSDPGRSYATRLNPRYTFDTFVIGESNRFAHAAAFAVGEEPAKSYNPLFIYGASGLGKTHLLHAIGHYTIALNPKRKVRYVSSEEFTNDFINAIQNNKNAEFQSEYRDIDVLLIDDIQFLQGKEQTQEAFFHTFNTLYSNNKQVVITSDQPPKKLSGFEERMLSRFEWGLMTDIQAPELETRIAILRRMAERDRLRVPDEVLSFMASRVSSNIRELEGALIRVMAFANLNSQPITMNLAQTVLKDVVPAGDVSTTTPNEIMSIVANFYRISVDDIAGTSRAQAIAQARQIAMYLCRDQTSLSLPKIGQLFGGKDHTTVLYAVRKIEKDMMNKREIYTHVTEILNRIKTGQKTS